MSTDFRDKSALRIPDGARLHVIVESASQHIQASGFLHREGTTTEEAWTHEMLFHAGVTRTLKAPNGYIAEVDVDFVGTATETATVTMTIEDQNGKQLRKWSEEFTHEKPWMGVMQYVISLP